MTIDSARRWPFACKALRRVSVAAVVAISAFGVTRGAIAQGDTHDLMEGRGRGVSFPVSCGTDIQPRFDAAVAALHSFWYGQALKEFTAISEAKPDCAHFLCAGAARNRRRARQDL